MNSISRAGVVVFAACAVACGSSDGDGGGGGGTDFGQKELASLGEACEGVGIHAGAGEAVYLT